MLTSGWKPLECSPHQLATALDDAGISDHEEVFAKTDEAVLFSTKSVGSLLHDISTFGTWGKYVLTTFEHQKIVKTPAFVDICED